MAKFFQLYNHILDVIDTTGMSLLFPYTYVEETGHHNHLISITDWPILMTRA